MEVIPGITNGIADYLSRMNDIDRALQGSVQKIVLTQITHRTIDFMMLIYCMSGMHMTMLIICSYV